MQHVSTTLEVDFQVQDQTAPPFQSIPEAELRRMFFAKMEPYFTIEAGGNLPEKATNPGHRPDFIMYHKTDTARQYPFIIEAKRYDTKKGTEIAEWLQQASKYRCAQYPYVYVFPRVSGFYLAEGSMVSKHNIEQTNHCNISTFIWYAYKIGQFVTYKKGPQQHYKFVLRDKCVWDSYTNMLNIDNLKILGYEI